VFVYTMWLKRRTPQNIVVGGAAGAFPPLIGWAAVTGGVDVLPLLLFAIVFFWTPPHFWALSLYAHSDYKRAGVPMLPVVSGAILTRRAVLVYTVLLVAVSLSPWALGYAGLVYGLSAAVLGLGFLVGAVRIVTDAQDGEGHSLTRDLPARQTFKYSLFYLFALFLALAVDRLVG
jgi:heme o synthase